jgi:hypothetical protein
LIAAARGFAPARRLTLVEAAMHPSTLRRLGVCVAVCVGLTPLFAAEPSPKEVKTEPIKGKVVRLAPLLEKFGARLDPDAEWLALAADDGKVYPLIKDDGSRMFFKDVRLLDRPMRLTGRLHPGSQMLQVITVHSYVKGELHEVFYWCDVCSIRRSEQKICDCCGGPMDLHEEPVKK